MAEGAPRDDRLVDLGLAAAAGVAGFLAIVGPWVLNVSNMLWLTTMKDSFTHYLGWEFYRRSAPAWPPGLSPDYGLQFSSSIVFSDSIPLLAMPLKLLSPLLPQVFQYTGWWTLACFVLQAWFAVRLVGLFSRDAIVKLGFAALLLFAPPFLWRLELHFSLIAHWIVLSALYLYFAPAGRYRPLVWLLLLAAATLIHTYFLAMCLPIWIASLLRRPAGAVIAWFVEAPLVLATILAALWLAGFFPLRPSLLTFGYGTFSLNLLAPINPNGTFHEPWSWSAILPMLPQGGGEYEGFNYLGAGGLLAVVLALPFAVLGGARRPKAPLWPLVVAAIGLTLFAISPMITIADLQLTIPVPDIVYSLAGSLRASGRFFWPVFYLLLLGAAWVLHRRFGRSVTGPLLLVLAALQIYDTYPGWSAFRGKFELEGDRWQTSLADPRVGAVATHYDAVRALPAGNSIPGWDQIAYFALQNRLSTDAVYLARPDDAAIAGYNATIDATIARHGLDGRSIYVLDNDYAKKIAQTMTESDEMFRAGDFYLFAPGWHNLGVATDLPLARNP